MQRHYLSKSTKVLADPFFRRFRVQPADEDLLDRFLLHGHGLLGVDLPPV